MEEDQLYLIKESSVKKFADLIRLYLDRPNPMPFEQIYDEVHSLIDYYETVSDVEEETEQWTRPSDWPNLDAFDLTSYGTQDVYIYTIDNRDRKGCVSYKPGAKSSTKYHKYELFSYDVPTGNFISLTSALLKGNNAINISVAGYDLDYVVLVISSNETNFNNCYIVSTVVGINCDYVMAPLIQPLLEVRVRAPSVVTLANGNSGRVTSTYTKRAKFENMSSVTTMNALLGNGTNYIQPQIEEAIFENFTTPNLTTILSFCDKCIYLKNLVGYETFDTRKVTTIQNAFRGCNSLLHLDLSRWSTPKCINFSYAFNGMANLRTIKLGLDFSNPAVTTFANMFSEDVNLREIDFSNCVAMSTSLTGNNSMANMFHKCTQLKHLNLANKFNFARTTSMSYFMTDCKLLESIDNATFNVSTALTNIANFAQGCRTLRVLDFRDGDFSGVTSANSMLDSNAALKEFHVSTFSNKLTNWTTTSLTTLQILDMEGCDLSGVTSAVSGRYYLAHTIRLPNFKKSVDISSCNMLTREGLLALIADLGEVTTSTTFKMNARARQMLTDAEVQVAIDKGWTVTVG